jgi:PAS domain S-box-containing protein
MYTFPDESQLNLHTIRNLAALAAIDWVDGRPLQVAEEFGDLVLNTLRLDFVYLRLNLGAVDELEVLRTLHEPGSHALTREIGQDLAPWLDNASTDEVRSLTNVLGLETVHVIAVQIGRDGSHGKLVAGSQQAAFPGAEDRLLLTLAVRQAETALRCRRAEEARRGLLLERDETLARLKLQFERMPIASIVCDPALRVVDWNPAAEKKLERSESLLAESQQVAHIGSWTWEITSGKLLWSDETYRIFGISPQETEMTFERFIALVHPDDRGVVRNGVDQALGDHQLFNCVYRALKQDGTIRIAQTRGTPVYDENNNAAHIFGTVQDVTEHRNAEKAIDESRRRFQAVFENALDGILLIDDTGRYVDVNPAICQLLGYTREEFLQMTVSDLTPVPHRERLPELLDRFLAAGTMTGEYTLLAKSGEARQGEYRAVTNILPGLHLSVHRDITERKRAEVALSQSEARFRFLIESIPHMVWTAHPDGSGDYHNPRYCDYVGEVADRLQGEGWADLIHPDDRQRVHVAWKNACAHASEYRIECRIRAKTGEYRWFLAHALAQWENDGRVLRWFGTCTDIDERKRAEEALRISEERLRQLLALMPTGVYTCDTEGRITFYNRRAVELWGREPGRDDRYCGAWRLWQMNGAPMAHDETPMANCVREGSSISAMNIVAERSNGDRAVLSVNIEPLVDERGRRAGAINVFEDITERKQAEEALRETAARLQVLSRRVVEVQEQERRHLARELHDEIGQVLSALSINIQALKAASGTAATALIDESLQIVDLATQQVRNLSLDLRPSMLDDLGLVATMRWYADRQAQRAGLSAHFIVDWAAPHLSGELTTAFFRVMQEAVTNAVRHARARQVWVELRQRDDEVELTIRDDGIGFNPESARHGVAHGERLGLLGIQERVELLGGRTEIKSRIGGGTSIRAWFLISSSPSFEARINMSPQ